jgi:hypothetical protein
MFRIKKERLNMKVEKCRINFAGNFKTNILSSKKEIRRQLLIFA